LATPPILQFGGFEDEDLQHAQELRGLNTALDNKPRNLAFGELPGQGRRVQALALRGSTIQKELSP